MSVSRRVLVAIESLAPLVARLGRDLVDLVGELRLVGEQSEERIVRRACPSRRLARGAPELPDDALDERALRVGWKALDLLENLLGVHHARPPVFAAVQP